MKSAPNLRVIRATDEPKYILPEERLWAVRQWVLTVVVIFALLFTTGAVSSVTFGTAWWSPVWLGFLLGFCVATLVGMERRARARRK